MTCAYYQGFDVARLTTGTLTLADTSGGGGANVVITLSSTTGLDGTASAQSSLFFHYEISAGGLLLFQPKCATSEPYAILEWSIEPYPRALRGDIRSGIFGASPSWPSLESNFTVTFDNDTGAFTFAYTSQFSMTFSDPVGSALLGFSGDQSGGTSYTSDIVPTYAVIPTVSGVHDPSPPYEPEAVSSRVMTADGIGGFGLSRTASPLYRDWVQPFETKAKTLRLAATSSHPTTLQSLIEDCRTVYPFVLHDGGLGDDLAAVFFLRPDGAYLDWAGIRDSATSDAAFNVPFRCVEIASVTE